jgi:hypothetical protein
MREIIIYDPDGSLYQEYEIFNDKNVEKLVKTYNIKFNWFNSLIELIIWVNNSHINITDSIFIGECKMEFAGYFNYSLLSFSTCSNNIPEFFSDIIDHVPKSKKPFSEIFITMFSRIYTDIDDGYMTKQDKTAVLDNLLEKNFNKHFHDGVYKSGSITSGFIPVLE